jgi:excisionase family DNA binding protein
MKTSDLSIKELAACIRVSTDTIRRAVRNGEIPSTRVRTALRFDLQEVSTYYAAERRGQVWGTLDSRRR